MILIYSSMGHSLRPDNLTITPDFVISDGTHNSGYVLVSATGGVASWKDPSDLPGFKTNHYIGELWGGGVVAGVWKENDIERCLIVALSNYSYYGYDYGYESFIYFITHIWSNISATSSATSSYDGLSNSNYIIAQSPLDTSNAAYLCLNYTNPDYGTGTFSNWYLPSLSEMQQVSNNSFKINFSIESYANFNSKGIETYFDSGVSNLYVNFIDGSYWTSTEVMNSGGLKAYSVGSGKYNKNLSLSVRPVRIASDTTLKIIGVSTVPTTPTSTYTVNLTSSVLGFGDLIVEIGVCWNGPYANSTSTIPGAYGVGSDKLAIPLPTISDYSIVSSTPPIGFYGDFNVTMPGFGTFNKTLGNYSFRSYAKTSKGDIKYGQQLVL